jgi:hypothetical protein
MRVFRLIVSAIFACNVHHEACHRQSTDWHDHEKQKLFQAHGFNPFKIRLANKCNAVAAKIQITVPPAINRFGPPEL